MLNVLDVLGMLPVEVVRSVLGVEVVVAVLAVLGVDVMRGVLGVRGPSPRPLRLSSAVRRW